MLTPVAAPQNLTEAIQYFADADRAFTFMVQMRWPDGVYCPRCACTEASLIRTRRLWKCKGCKKQFSVKVGTIFEDSPLGLDKWLPTLYLLANCRNGVSSYEVARSLGVTQKTAWFMLHRIRLAMQAESFERTQATIEIDETFIGGKSVNMHAKRRTRMLKGTRAGATGKTGVIAAVKRGKGKGSSKVYAKVLNSTHAKPYSRIVADTALPGSTVYTDGAMVSDGALDGCVREIVNHAAKEYVRGAVHTNSVENFWSLLKRAIKGTYISVDPFHLFRYVDEQVFRYNVRTESEADRFMGVLRSIVGKRLTYDGLTGAGLNPATT
jgi:transposase-like protein